MSNPYESAAAIPAEIVLQMRVAGLEAENATLKQERDAFLEKWEAAADASLRRQAALVQSDADFKSMSALHDFVADERDKAIAERDRLRQALQDIAKQHNTYEQDENEQEADNLDEAYDMIIARARRSISPSETEEGG